MQAFAYIDERESELMAQKDITDKLERLTGRVTAIEKELRKPSNGKKGKDWLLILSIATLAVSVIGIPIMLLGWIEPHLENDLRNTVSVEVTAQLKQPTADVADIKGQLKILAPLIQELATKKIASIGNLSTRDLIAQLPELTTLLRVAKKEKITVDPKTLEAAGKKLVNTGGEQAWNGVIDLVDYKSFLNLTLATADALPTPGSGQYVTRYVDRHLPGYPSPAFSVAGLVEKDKSALYRQIGQADLNENNAVGNGWIAVTGGGEIIDGYELRKVIFRHVHIVYNGGPLSLNDVYFLDCTFELRQSDNAQRLVTKLLEPTPRLDQFKVLTAQS